MKPSLLTAGLAAIGLLLAAAPSCAAVEDVALTYDDLPSPDFGASRQRSAPTTEKLLRALKRNHAPAIGFVNEDKLAVPGEVDARTRTLDCGFRPAWSWATTAMGIRTCTPCRSRPMNGRCWTASRSPAPCWPSVARGCATGAFPFSHTGPDAQTKEAFEAFLARPRLPRRALHLRVRRLHLRQGLLGREVQGRRATAAKVASAYLAHIATVLGTCEQEAQFVFGRAVRRSSSATANALNADTAEPFLKLFRQRGYGFVSLDAALADPALHTRTGP